MSCVESQARPKPESEQGDACDTLQQIVSRSGSSVVSHLLAIERHALEVRKAHVWAENPLCLVYEEVSTRCFKVVRNRNLEQQFVAISWTWQPSPHEDGRSGAYFAEHSNPRGIERLKVRDCVLARVTKYLQHKGLKLFWIDQVCIDQDDKEAKTNAMNSMDLIYKNARNTLGLLSTPIESTIELRLMVRLMNGELTFQSARGLSAFRPHISRGTIERTICVLKRLTEDTWWKRAWVFQEEYVAGINMDLLFPLNVVRLGCSGYERIPGEFCVSATFFRQQTTLLLLAYQQNGSRRHRASCEKMLKIIGKYQILLQHQSTGFMPMSATIHSEIQRRRLKNPWDRLAIAANACDYGVRLDHRALSDQRLSIGMSLLAQYLLNGEIVMLHRRGEGRTDAVLGTSAIRWMQDTRLKGCKPPAGTKPLSFLRLCRLPEVCFCFDGVRTRGLIWHLEGRHVLPRAATLFCQPWAAQEIDDLVYRLGRRHRRLADKLDDYVQKRRRGVEFTACCYMDAMMWQVVQAVNRGHHLRIGYSRTRKCAGVFVPESHEVHRDMYAFTAWQSGTFTAGSSDKFVSLSVNARYNTVTSALGWMNGLVFFRNDDLQNVTFAWPEGWKS
ncbi:uncharacterized protein LTR77_002399 [Saxophila tyrrhenica]|uniref:Heterokaryon incompatibility domain-containing protein n=1 Tax=Saxophila tyrrhenica TaxID=1690608 RepID=A0AAV9PJF1_9PEZI|nr:hypothetical protein LTR77_002399 [Saxophila tyrrhenica]